MNAITLRSARTGCDPASEDFVARFQAHMRSYSIDPGSLRLGEAEARAGRPAGIVFKYDLPDVYPEPMAMAFAKRIVESMVQEAGFYGSVEIVCGDSSYIGYSDDISRSGVA